MASTTDSGTRSWQTVAVYAALDGGVPVYRGAYASAPAALREADYWEYDRRATHVRVVGGDAGARGVLYDSQDAREIADDREHTYTERRV